MRTCAQQSIQRRISISITGRDAVQRRCAGKGYLCPKYIIALAEQNATLVFDVRGMDLHQYLGIY